MSETTAYQEPVVTTFLSSEGENLPFQMVIMDAERDPALVDEVRDGVNRIRNPKPEDKQILQKSHGDLRLLMKFITQEHHTLSGYNRDFILKPDGSFDSNPEEPEALPPNDNFEEGKATYLGPLIAEKGDRCYGQSLYSSVILDNLGYDNTVVQLKTPDPSEPDHALLVVRSQGENVVFDPMWGLMIPLKDHKDVYTDLYINQNRMKYAGDVKKNTEKVIIPTNA